MAFVKHRVFISYHHANDQGYKNALLNLNAAHGLFIDGSVDIGDIGDHLDDQAIRTKIRDEYLKDSSITIVLVGLQTKGRKHVDWEIYSSMYDGAVNKQSGVLVIMLPSTVCTYYTAAHGDAEKAAVYPENASWMAVTTREEYERRYPYAPARIIDNLLAPKALVSVTHWDRIAQNPAALYFLLEKTYEDRASCEYDLSRPMRRADT